jgi:ferric-dicitrate binding protein FerR (iron transport regulator)
MNETNDISENVQDLIDAYVDGTIDDGRLQDLEAMLRGHAEVRSYFVRYCRLHTDLDLEARARQASKRVLKTINAPEPASASARKTRFASTTLNSWLGAAAVLILTVFGVWAWWRPHQESPLEKDRTREEIAWVINAQNCQWAENLAPAGDMQAGKMLSLERGLVEIHLQKGARIVMEGPAHIEIVSANSVRMRRGKLTAKVPDAAKGFQVFTPKGRVVDLGTEFAMAVDEDGTTDVYVYAGKVEAHGVDASTKVVNLLEKQSARIDVAGAQIKMDAPALKPFMRDIPIIVPRELKLFFREPIDHTLLDAKGRGTGLTHRLPGTGRRLKKNDDNLFLNQAAGQLELTTTNSDLNTQFQLDQGEYVGIKLSDLGFTGAEDFALTVVVPNIPALERVGQFGLFAGPRSDGSIRGGLLSSKEPEQYRQFLVRNQAGNDAPPHFVGLAASGDDLRLTLRREGKLYSLTVENLTTNHSTSLTMPQPVSLEGERDLCVGFFGANTQSELRRTIVLKEFRATVWTRVQ